MSLGLAEYSYSRVLVCEIYSTQLIIIMTSLGNPYPERTADGRSSLMSHV